MDKEYLIKKKIKEINIRKDEINILIKNLFNNKNFNKELYKKLNCEKNEIENFIFNFNKLNNINNYISEIKSVLNDKDIGLLANEELNKYLILKEEILNNLMSIENNLSNDNKHNKGCYLEIRSGTGGYEASLFVNDLLKMYMYFFEKQNWKYEIINKNFNPNKLYKEVIIKISDFKSFNILKYESGGHRVQRIPETESQGRIHTSNCTVVVMPILSEIEFKKINICDLKIDTFKSSGAGGQHVNTTDSAIRLTHIPTGLVVECQDERSQHKNKSKALSILQSRLFVLEKTKKKTEENNIRKNLISSGQRSDRIRTYNFLKQRITDHRISFNTYKLYEILNGNLNILINEYKKHNFKI